MLPMLSASFVNPLTIASAARIRPSGAVSTTILLSVAALALGCGIALLLRAELRESAAKKTQSERAKRKAPEAADTPLLSSVKRSLLKAKVYELDSAKELLKEGHDEHYYEEDAPEEEKIPCAVGAAGEDEISEVSYAPPSDDDSTSAKHRRHKCEINLDVIANSFEAGELVTLDALKRRNIVPKRADHLKILARGALSKPLIIEAHDFTHAAEEILKAAGGEAIRIHH